MSFNVDLQTTVDSFDAAAQSAYKHVLATLLETPYTSIVVEVLTTGAQRRLLANTIKVANRVTVPDSIAPNIKARFSAVVFRKALKDDSDLVALDMSAPMVTSTTVGIDVTASTEGMSMGIIIAIIGGCIVLVVGVAWMCHGHDHSLQYMPLAAPAQKQVVDTNAPLPTVVSLKTDGFMKMPKNPV